MKNEVKELLFDLFKKYDDYDEIKDSLRSLESDKEISSDDYDFIIVNYSELLKEWENEKERQEHLFYTNSLHDEYLQKTEKRGASYGELSFIENLDNDALEELDNALIEEIEKMDANN